MSCALLIHRLLIAQATAEQLVVVTDDDRFGDYGIPVGSYSE